MLEILNIIYFSKKYKKLIIFIILNWIALWLSIDTYLNLSQIKNFEISLIALFNSARVSIAFFTIFISTILILYLVLKKKKIYNNTNNLLFILFF